MTPVLRNNRHICGGPELKHIPMKKTFLITIALLCRFLVFAQNELQIQNSDKGPFLVHVVTAKENFYSVGRLFNAPPKDIAAFNGLDMSKGLTIGEIVKIPLSAGNFSQAKEGGRPVYYVVGQKEGLYRVSLKNNNVLMANLRKWNHLAKDDISTGQKLIVGYLISPEAQNVTADAPVKDIPATIPEKPVTQPQRQEPPVETTIKDNPPKREDAPKKTEPERKPETLPARPPANTNPQTAISDGNGGYFHGQYDQQVRSQSPKVDETASAGIFKTASGWQDAKYYALMDHVEPGTIIRIINPTNNKAIYAKVLGEMSGIRQNQGYDVRISNAAASALEVSDTEKFIVRVNY